MKKIFIKLFFAVGAVAAFGACKDFQKINEDPNAILERDVQPEMLLNRSIYDAQMDGHISDRIFMRYWVYGTGYASRASGDPYLSVFNTDNSWNTDFWGMGYSSGWVKNPTLAIQIGIKRIAEGQGETVKPALGNIVQMCRIWRAAMLANLTDNYGPINVLGDFAGEESPFVTVEAVYAEILKELSEAVAAIDFDGAKKLTKEESLCDAIFEGDMTKWARFANSLRMRYAIRIASVNPTLAQEQFEAAASDPKGYISENSFNAAVRQDGGWAGPLSVYNRSTGQYMSRTMANLTFGLGGVDASNLLGVDKTSLKLIEQITYDKYSADPNQYMGIKMDAYLPTETNIDGGNFFFDKIPSKIDPRIFFNFSFPGVIDPVMQFAPLSQSGGKFDAVKMPYFTADGTSTEDTVLMRSAYTWFTRSPGTYGTKGSRLQGWLVSENQMHYPNISANIRNNDRKREWFNAAESYFLIAEAALNGWAGGLSAQTAYELGITKSFESYGISNLVSSYIASKEYNRVGTSVDFGHTTEATAKAMQYVDFADANNFETVSGKTKKIKDSPVLKTDYNYPYKPKGYYDTNNDKLTKIITQKYIANMPWIPLEAWSDYRRLILPFKEKPMLADGGTITSMPDYSKAEATSKMTVSMVPQRLPYPSSMQTNSAQLYMQALELLGGPDVVKTPISWAKK